MKKLLVSLLLLLTFTSIGSTITSANDMGAEKGAVLEWSMFTRSQASSPANGAGKALDCNLERTTAIILSEATDIEGYEKTIEELKKTDPGYVRDIKGCILQEKADSIIKWLVYLSIIVIMLYVLWTLAMTYLGGGKSGGNDMMDPMGGGGGGNDDVMKKIKAPLVALAILFLIVLGVVNIILEGIAWLKDVLVG